MNAPDGLLMLETEYLLFGVGRIKKKTSSKWGEREEKEEIEQK